MNDSIIQSFTTHLHDALAKALDFGREFGHDEITNLHLLYGLAAEKGSLSSEILAKVNFPLDLLKQELVRKHHSPYLNDSQNPKLDDQSITILTKAVRTAQLHEHTYVGTEHVLACLLNLADHDIKELFNLWHININEMQRQLLVVLKSTSKFPDLTETLRHLQSMHEDDFSESPEFPLLETLGQELTTQAFIDSCPPLIGRDEEVMRIQQILSRRFKNNPLLVGKPGVGKTAIVEGLARAILSPKANHTLRHKRIFSIEISSLVAGTMYRGEFEQKMKALIEELRENPHIILFIDEIHTLMGAGSTGQPLDAANILKPALARGEIHVIGATTWAEYQKHLSSDQALTRRFQTITVNEPNAEESRQILYGVKNSFEDYHNVSISDKAIEEALSLSTRYLTHTCLPDKAIDLIDDASSQRNIHKKVDDVETERKKLKVEMTSLHKKKQELINADQYDKAISINKKLKGLLEKLNNLSKVKVRRLKISDQHIRQAVAMRTGLDIDRLEIKSEPISNKILSGLQNKIIGQDEALTRIASAIQRGYSPLKEEGKPIGSYLFLGPSGIGKTATAKALASELFSDEHAIIRLDMSEYSEKFTISKLIGAPAGYVGYQENGQLTKAIQQQPLSVVLFDEVEKAHPDVFNLLLQILDEGKIKDAHGEIADFRHSVIVMTSNLGLKDLHNRVGFSSNSNIDKKKIIEEMGSAAKDFFRMELLNRLDDIIYFSPLEIEHRKAIINIKINELNSRLNDIINIGISDSAMQVIAENIYSEEQGVRSIEKIIREKIEIPLSESIGSYKKGTTINLDLDGDTLKLKVKTKIKT